MCRCKKEKNLITALLYSPQCRPKKKKNPKKSWQISHKKLKKENNDIFHIFMSSIQNFLTSQALVRYLQINKRPSENTISSYDPSESLFSTLDAESCTILKLNPPKKGTKLSDVTFSSGEEDDVLGNIHPSHKSKTIFLDEEDPLLDPGSPLDRSMPISDYETEETQAFSMNPKTENLCQKKE